MLKFITQCSQLNPKKSAGSGIGDVLDRTYDDLHMALASRTRRPKEGWGADLLGQRCWKLGYHLS